MLDWTTCSIVLAALLFAAYRNPVYTVDLLWYGRKTGEDWLLIFVPVAFQAVIAGLVAAVSSLWFPVAIWRAIWVTLSSGIGATLLQAGLYRLYCPPGNRALRESDALVDALGSAVAYKHVTPVLWHHAVRFGGAADLVFITLLRAIYVGSAVGVAALAGLVIG